MGLLKYISDKLYSNDKEVALLDDVIGVNQTYQNMTASRAYEIEYTNNTSKPIEVTILASITSVNPEGLFPLIDGLEVGGCSTFSDGTKVIYISATCIVPVGSTYNILRAGSPTLYNWIELRGD